MDYVDLNNVLDSNYSTLAAQLHQAAPISQNVHTFRAHAHEEFTNQRAQWESNYARLPMPPPPPGIWETRDELIASAKEFAEAHGYGIVIGHSSKHAGEASRCWLTCTLGGTYRNRHHLTPEMRKRKRESRKTDCPMRVLATKRKHDTGWILHLPDPTKATHNHGSNKDEDASPPPPPDFPELEEALFAWQQQCVADGIPVHGNTLKAKAIELYKSMPVYADRGPMPELGANWLNDYRKRQGLPVRTVKGQVNVKNPVQAAQYLEMEDMLPIPPEDRDLFKATRKFVKDYMSKFDASHDWEHIMRVVTTALRIYSQETANYPTLQYDTSALFLSAMLHDVGDKKYADPGQDVENQIAEILLDRGASDSLALKVQMIAKNVSYSTETKNPRMTRAILQQHPELGIVQDADRLDAIGAIGIGRAFTYGGAKGREGGMQDTIAHFDEKLLKIEGLMKTQTGAAIARERTERLELFKQWWEHERGNGSMDRGMTLT